MVAAIVVGVVGYYNDFWLLAPKVGVDPLSIRLRSMTLTPGPPPVFNTFVSLNLTLTNRMSISATVNSASARAYYLDGAMAKAFAANPSSAPAPSEYFLADGVTAMSDMLIAGDSKNIIPLDIRAQNSFANNAAVFALVTRDCSVLPLSGGAGLYLRFYITGVATLGPLSKVKVPEIKIDVKVADPPCIR